MSIRLNVSPRHSYRYNNINADIAVPAVAGPWGQRCGNRAGSEEQLAPMLPAAAQWVRRRRLACEGYFYPQTVDKRARRPVSRVLSAAGQAGTGRPFLWNGCRHPLRAANPDGGAGMPPRPSHSRVTPPATPIRPCSRWGLPCRPRCRGRGALLPHPFTLARSARRDGAGGLLSVALSLRSPSPVVDRHRIPVEPGLSSSRGSLPGQRPSGRLTRR